MTADPKTDISKNVKQRKVSKMKINDYKPNGCTHVVERQLCLLDYGLCKCKMVFQMYFKEADILQVIQSNMLHNQVIDFFEK